MTEPSGAALNTMRRGAGAPAWIAERDTQEVRFDSGRVHNQKAKIVNERDFDITTISSLEKIDFRQRIKLAESNGWIIRSVSVADGITTATIYRPYQP